MTPKNVYPIGTQLITHRLSQASLISELFGEDDFSSYIPVPETYDELGNCPRKLKETTFVMKWRPCFHYYADSWRVTITAENQKCFSPVPIVGDFVWIENMGMGFEIGAIADNVVFKSAHKSPFADTESGHSVSNFYCSIKDNPKIISRIYPNNYRAPLIEWDEMILPKTGELS